MRDFGSVMERKGESAFKNVIMAGINWCVQQPTQVWGKWIANLSLDTGLQSLLLDQAKGDACRGCSHGGRLWMSEFLCFLHVSFRQLLQQLEPNDEKNSFSNYGPCTHGTGCAISKKFANCHWQRFVWNLKNHLTDHTTKEVTGPKKRLTEAKR